MTMHELTTKLFKIPRSITGDGFRKSLNIIKEELKSSASQNKEGGKPAISSNLKIYSVKSGEKCFDWIVPPEWIVKDAYIITPSGRKICEFDKNNLHLLNYSAPFHAKIGLNELQGHLYSLPRLPRAIPYATSYYERRWGFCISQNERDALEDGIYEVFIDTAFKEDGELNYGEIFIPATSDEPSENLNSDEIKPERKSKGEILFSTYLCHPQMANNELSGPVVWTQLVKFIRTLPQRRYDYRFIVVPETIGSIAYVSRNFDYLKSNVKACFVLSCLRDERAYSVVLSPSENSLSDRAALHTLKFLTKEPKIYSFLYRGSDERQFNTPALNLGSVAICRSKFGEYEEYHTSLDDLNFVTQKGLEGGFEYAKNIVLNLEADTVYKPNFVCEPNLGRRGLIATINAGAYPQEMMNVRNFLAYCDGKRDALQIAEILGVELRKLKETIKKCVEFELIKED